MHKYVDAFIRERNDDLENKKSRIMQRTPPQMEEHLSTQQRGQVSAGPSLVGPASESNAWIPLQGLTFEPRSRGWNVMKSAHI